MSWFTDFFAKIAGRKIASELNLTEETMPTKPWYTSKTIWSCIVNFLIATYGLVGQYLVPAFPGLHLPAIPGIALAVLSGIGIYSRATSTTTITTN